MSRLGCLIQQGTDRHVSWDCKKPIYKSAKIERTEPTFAKKEEKLANSQKKLPRLVHPEFIEFGPFHFFSPDRWRSRKKERKRVKRLKELKESKIFFKQ